MDEQNIPIDIITSKLLEWLISRRHVSSDWQSKILKVREKINNAIQDMPEHDGMVELLKGQHINYFHCLKIIEILKETEADTKNLFGRYGSQRMKDWQEIVKLYQRDNLYLAESAQILIRNVNFEIPGLRKQILKFDVIQDDCYYKITNSNKVANRAITEFTAICKQLGIAGENIKSELLSLLWQLPDIYENAAIKTKKIQEAVDFYTAFVKFHIGDDTVLPLLKYVIANGNTTVYEYKYNEKPRSVQSPVTNLEEETIKNSETTIDFGDSIDTNESLDFGITVETGTIDWGNGENLAIVESELDMNIKQSEIVLEETRPEDGELHGKETLPSLVNPNSKVDVCSKVSGIVVEESGCIDNKVHMQEVSTISINPNSEHSKSDPNSKESEIVVEGSGREHSEVLEKEVITILDNYDTEYFNLELNVHAHGEARGEEALTILDNPNTRELFVNDLTELEAFLSMRIYEMSNESDLVSISQLLDASAELQIQTTDVIQSMLSNVKTIMNDLLNERTQHLHNIKHSPKYVDTLAANLTHKLTVVERAKTNMQNINEKIKESEMKALTLQPVVQLVIEKTKTLQEEIENDISKKYKGRPVHIVGAVKTL